MNNESCAGFDAYCNGEDLPEDASPDFKLGYLAARDDHSKMVASEADDSADSTIRYYETDGMAAIRSYITGDKVGMSNQDVDSFKAVLTALERKGFTLTGPSQINPCECIDCGGREPSHASDCTYMNETFGDA